MSVRLDNLTDRELDLMVARQREARREIRMKDLIIAQVSRELRAYKRWFKRKNRAEANPT